MALFNVEVECIAKYDKHANKEVARVTRNLNGLSADDKAELVRTPEVQVGVMQEAVKLNSEFLKSVKTLIEESKSGFTGRVRERIQTRPASSPSHKTVEKGMSLLVREWTSEGEVERAECFKRLLDALDANLGEKQKAAASSGEAKPRVLVPAAHVGRLPFEVQTRGYDCEAVEYSVIPYFISEFVRKNGATAEAHTMRPYVLGTCNRVKATDNVRDLKFPQVAVAADSLPEIHLDDFMKRYDSPSSRGTFDAVLTNCSLDTSANIFRYVRTVAHVLKPGGMWANFGPLAFDQAHDEAHGQCMEISWEELKFAVSQFFEIKEEAIVDSMIGENALSMMQFQYGCIYFTAIRNEKTAPGIGLVHA